MPFLAPVVAAVGSIFAATGIAATIVKTAVVLGVSFLANKLLAPKVKPQGQPEAGPTGAQLSLQSGGDVPRQIAAGMVATKGSLVDAFVHGEDNIYVTMVFALSDSHCHALDAVWIDGKRHTFGGEDGELGRPVEGFDAPSRQEDSTIYVKFYSGAVGQNADPFLVSPPSPYSQNFPSGRWTSNDRLAGIAYVRVTCIYSEEKFNSLPEFLWVLQGTRFYDWRKDGTAGGLGAHRWTNQATWEWSENPIVVLYGYLRGYSRNAEMVVGQGVSPIDLPLDAWTAAANACDEPVLNPDESQEKRFTVAAILSSAVQHADMIEGILEACGGALIERAGEYHPIVAIAQPTAATIADADLLREAPVEYAAKRSRAELVNFVSGTYIEPGEGWQPIAYPARSDAADEALDGGERLSGDLTLEMVRSRALAQRLAEIYRRRARHQATATITLPYRWLPLDAGDWIRWESDRFGFDKRFMIVARTLNADRTVTLSLQETSSVVYSVPGDEEAGYVPNEPPVLAARLSTVIGFFVEGASVPGDTGLIVPAIRCYWQPREDPTILSVPIRYRPVGTTDWQYYDHPDPQAGVVVITAGVQASTTYEVQASITTSPRRLTTWTFTLLAVTTNTHIVPFASGLVDIATQTYYFGQAIVQAVDRVVAGEERSDSLMALLGEQRDRLERISAAITSEIARSYMLADDDEQALAIVEERVVTRISETEGAFALFEQEVSTRLGDAESSVTTISQSLSTLDAAVASFEIEVAAEFGEVEIGLTQTATAVATIEGALAGSWGVALDVNGNVTGAISLTGGTDYSSFDVIANRFSVSQPGVSGGAKQTVFAIQTVDGTTQLALRGDLIADGLITARAINVANLAAISATLGNVAVSGTLIVNGTIITPKMISNAVTKISSASGFSNRGDSSPGGSPSSPILTVSVSADYAGDLIVWANAAADADNTTMLVRVNGDDQALASSGQGGRTTAVHFRLSAGGGNSYTVELFVYGNSANIPSRGLTAMLVKR